MFAARAKKSKPKRKSASEAEDDDVQQDPVITPLKSKIPKGPLNTFSSCGKTNTMRNLVDSTTIESERDVVPHTYGGDATCETQIDTGRDRDARAIMEKNIKANQEESINEASGRIYKGQFAYKNYVAKKESQIGMNKYTGTQGPIRAQSWARSICRFDYQPDVCKDYKETGFCGYGDSCKFLHDRGDYKSGWQIEKEYQEQHRKKNARLLEGKTLLDALKEDDDAYLIQSDEEEQFACTICRGPFQNAVETICGHYFCEACALKQFRKTSRCFNCQKQTNGVFNAAKKLRQKNESSL